MNVQTCRRDHAIMGMAMPMTLSSPNGYDFDWVGWQVLNVQTRLYDYGYGYHLGFDHTS